MQYTTNITHLIYKTEYNIWCMSRTLYRLNGTKICNIPPDIIKSMGDDEEMIHIILPGNKNYPKCPDCSGLITYIGSDYEKRICEDCGLEMRDIEDKT